MFDTRGRIGVLETPAPALTGRGHDQHWSADLTDPTHRLPHDGNTPNLEKYRLAAELADIDQWMRDRSKVTESGCREWQLARIKGKGYGVATPQRKNGALLAHRLAYWIWVSPLTDDRVVDHMCQNRACIEPTHLRLLSRAENTALAAPALSATCKRDHPLSGDNLYLYTDPRGRTHRTCRTCRLDIDRRYKAKGRDAK